MNELKEDKYKFVNCDHRFIEQLIKKKIYDDQGILFDTFLGS